MITFDFPSFTPLACQLSQFFQQGVQLSLSLEQPCLVKLHLDNTVFSCLLDNLKEWVSFSLIWHYHCTSVEKLCLRLLHLAETGDKLFQSVLGLLRHLVVVFEALSGLE